jgi:hypothetical protein
VECPAIGGGAAIESAAAAAAAATATAHQCTRTLGNKAPKHHDCRHIVGIVSIVVDVFIVKHIDDRHLSRIDIRFCDWLTSGAQSESRHSIGPLAHVCSDSCSDCID